MKIGVVAFSVPIRHFPIINGVQKTLGSFQFESQPSPAMGKIDEGSRYLGMGGNLSNLQGITCLGTTLLGVPGH